MSSPIEAFPTVSALSEYLYYLKWSERGQHRYSQGLAAAGALNTSNIAPVDIARFIPNRGLLVGHRPTLGVNEALLVGEGCGHGSAYEDDSLVGRLGQLPQQ
jgi:hypothetical protein